LEVLSLGAWFGDGWMDVGCCTPLGSPNPDGVEDSPNNRFMKSNMLAHLQETHPHHSRTAQQLEVI
jgi:hypothetical protein